MNLIEKTTTENYLYNGSIINLRRDEVILPNGKNAYREVVEHLGGVCVAALTEDNEILFVRQFRYPYKEVILEIPAGKRNSAEEDPLLCGKRELKEETGIQAEDYISLGELYPSPGYCGEIIYMYAAKNLSFGENKTDEDEFLEPVKISLAKAVEMVMSSKIKDAKTQTAVLKLKMLKDLNKF